MNFIHIAGNLGADPEVRFTSTGKKVTTLRVATKARKGSNHDETIWWRVTIWGEQYDKFVSFLKKGSSVMVFGEVQKPDIFTDREGKQHVSMELTASHIQFSPFGSGKGSAEGGAQQHQAGPVSSMNEGIPQSPYTKSPSAPAQAPVGQTFDDEVPF